ncbi:hypothetical protein [Chamaesiphon sp.]|uniref:hypothetical protein n=1 Tax=Chamaesiphon sp. TaxID=2814140 RepID=UPI00359379D6
MKNILPISLAIGLSLSLIPTIASAQFNNTFDGNSGDNRNPFSRANNGDTSGLLNLINQAQLNGKINPNYSNEQREQLNSATEDFRARQSQALRDRNKKTTAPTTIVQPK